MSITSAMEGFPHAEKKPEEPENKENLFEKSKDWIASKFEEVKNKTLEIAKEIGEDEIATAAFVAFEAFMLTRIFKDASVMEHLIGQVGHVAVPLGGHIGHGVETGLVYGPGNNEPMMKDFAIATIIPWLVYNFEEFIPRFKRSDKKENNSQKIEEASEEVAFGENRSQQVEGITEKESLAEDTRLQGQADAEKIEDILKNIKG